MNRAEQRKYHAIYKTTCIVAKKFYLGMHSTDNLDGGYLGSGSILSRSIKKHGREKHFIEILINPELRSDLMCMNIRSGGTGNQHGSSLKEETKIKVSEGLKKRGHKDWQMAI
jgi:hypothetical protein